MDVNEFINNSLGISVRTYTEGFTIYINAEDVARGLGFVSKNTNGYESKKMCATSCTQKIYEVIRWSTINKYLEEHNYPDLPVNKDSFIPESYFYLLAMKAKSKIAKEFQFWLATEVIPSIRKLGRYVDPSHKNVRELSKRVRDKEESAIIRLINYGRSQGYKIDKNRMFSTVTLATQRDVCNIPVAGKDLANTADLCRLIEVEKDVERIIDVGIALGKEFTEIYNEVISLYKSGTVDYVTFGTDFIWFDYDKVKNAYVGHVRFKKKKIIIRIDGVEYKIPFLVN